MKVHCLFEQSGTFKNEFKKLGYEAFDYDIQNEFGETDYVIDLYAEIDKGYEGKPSIFDDIKKEDLILAFFPCTRFEAQILLSFWGQQYQDKNMSLLDKFERNLRLHNELHRNYELVTRMVIVCLRKGLRLVIENPAGEQHYLTRYWCAKAQLVDKNRRDNGDYFKKPTQFWFFNFEPYHNFIFEAIDYVEPKTWSGLSQTERSMIHPQYANRFIRQYLIEGVEDEWTKAFLSK
jgi:hypothetical protein